ncbi:hypothetical protein [Salinibius halmophilus]|uniref:hypothetical protein n=1 Tax=Salinibius halmophilus TaxID=1853216 RepID=UPI000E670190|nr:hypothetical protein [Salinibius halmophilus]
MAEPTVRDDEIDLRELFLRIWATRVKVVSAVLIVSALYACFVAFQYITRDKTTTYSQVFTLTFDGLANGEYPDGSPFSITDLVANSVVQQVYQNQPGLQNVMSRTAFSRAITVERYSPDYFLIVERYERMNREGMTPEQLASLQQEMQAALRASGALKLSLTTPEPINNAIPRQALNAIASEWAKQAIEEKGVLRLNTPIYSERIFDAQRFEQLDYLVGIELLLENVEKVKENIAALKELPGSTGVIDDETGYTLEDLEKALEDVANYDLRQLIDPVKRLGIAKDPELVKLFYQSRLVDLELEKQQYTRSAQIARQVLAEYSGNTNLAVSQNNSLPQNALVPQLGDGFLDRLLEVSRQGDDLGYQQKLTDQVLEFENQALKVDQQIAEINLTLNALEDQSNSQTLLSQYAQSVSERMPKLLQTLRDYTGVVARLHEQISEDSIGAIGGLVQAESSSFVVGRVQFPLRSSIVLLIAVCLVVSILTVIAALIGSMVKSKKLESLQ